jgi:hypothetical protein
MHNPGNITCPVHTESAFLRSYRSPITWKSLCRSIRARMASRPSRTGEKQCPIERPADYLLFINPQLARFQPADHL